MNIQIIKDGIVVDMIVVPSGTVISPDHTKITGPDFSRDGDGYHFYQQNGAQIGWLLEDNQLVPKGLNEETIDDLKFQTVSKFRVQCETAITGGFFSDALGLPHRYPSKQTDQINLMGSVTASLLPDAGPDWHTPFWCANSDNEWGYLDHSAKQIQKAGADGKAHVILCQTTLVDLAYRVYEAKTPDDLREIKWPE